MASPCSLQIDGQDEAGMRTAAAAAIAEVQRIEAGFIAAFGADSPLLLEALPVVSPPQPSLPSAPGSRD